MRDYVGDPRLSRVSFVSLQTFVKAQAASDDKILAEVNGAASKFALATLAEEKGIILDALLSSVPRLAEETVVWAAKAAAGRRAVDEEESARLAEAAAQRHVAEEALRVQHSEAELAARKRKNARARRNLLVERKRGSTRRAEHSLCCLSLWRSPSTPSSQCLAARSSHSDQGSR